MATSPVAASAEPVLSISRREGKNHLGNVLLVFSDRKLQTDGDGTIFSHYGADIHAYSDYYPYGMLMPGRHVSAGGYRFGFQGQETDDEVYGNGNSYTAQFWQYDSRLGKRWNLDPKPNSSISQYSTFSNNPMLYTDPKGDTIRLSGAFTLSAQFRAYISWRKTENGRQFHSDYDIGGKYEHVTVVFDATEGIGSNTDAETTYTVRTRDGETRTLIAKEVFDKAVKEGKSVEGYTTGLSDGDQLTATIRFNYARPMIETPELVKAYQNVGTTFRSMEILGRAKHVNTLIHETQHTTLAVSELRKRNRIFTADYEHRNLIYPIDGDMYKERRSAVEALFGPELRRRYEQFNNAKDSYGDWLYKALEGQATIIRKGQK